MKLNRLKKGWWKSPYTEDELWKAYVIALVWSAVLWMLEVLPITFFLAGLLFPLAVWASVVGSRWVNLKVYGP